MTETPEVVALSASTTLASVKGELELAAAGQEQECRRHLREMRREDPGTWTRRSAVRARELQVGYVTPSGDKEVCSWVGRSKLRLSDIRSAQELARKAGADRIFVEGGFDYVVDAFGGDDYEPSEGFYTVEVLCAG